MLERDMTVIDCDLPISATGDVEILSFDPGEGFVVTDIHLRAPKGENYVPGTVTMHFRIEAHAGQMGYSPLITPSHSIQLPAGYVLAKFPAIVDGLYMFSRMVGSGTTRAKLFAVITAAYPVAGKVAHVSVTGYRDDLDA